MNDRYLYRAKRKSDKQWIYGNLVQTDGGVYIIQNYVPQHLIENYEVDPSTICQCTGLKDKYGKMIFENDIVKVHDDEEPCLIEWGEDTARWNMTQYGSCVYDFDNYWSYEVEVIGSAIENPELLESKGCD